jgi:hypothetical protein
MKLVKWLIVLIGFLPWVEAEAQLEKLPDLRSDTTELDRDRISRDLIVVRDSLNGFLADLAHRSEQPDKPVMARRTLNKSISELSYHRSEINAVIEEVAMIKPGTWNRVIRERSLRIVREVRENIRRVREDVKGLASARS